MIVSTKAGAIRGLYAIIDSTYIAPDNFAAVARNILKGGCRIIQVRVKGFPIEDIMEEIREARDAVVSGGGIFIVNDSSFAALESGADGVHIGQCDGSPEEARRILGAHAVIGVSTHNVREALEAEANGADYISFGPVFPTRTKKDADEPKGLAALTEVADAVNIPVVAIGGITVATAHEVLLCGASATAIISDILLSGDIAGRVAAVISAINRPHG